MMKIYVSVELGNPAAECAHYGICSVEVIDPKQWIDFAPRHFRHVKAVLTLFAPDTLMIAFAIEGMRADTLAYFFPASGFRVDAPKWLPADVQEALETTQPVFIQRGVYPAYVADTYIIVECKMVVAEVVAA